VIVAAIKEAGRPAFYALTVLAVSFLPVLSLEAQEARLFKPLAYTKTFAMLIAAVLAITLDPALRLMLTRVRSYRSPPRCLSGVVNTFALGRIRSEREHPICGPLIRLYQPVVAWSLRRKSLVLGAAGAAMALTIPAFRQLGNEIHAPARRRRGAIHALNDSGHLGG
jgi:Cu(I)/Ag(I) efflux system membrane protein CusA/SilA